MKKYLILSAVAFQSIFVFAQTSEQIPYMTKSLANDALQNIEAQTSGGNITVEGGNSSNAHIDVFVKDNNGKTLSNDEIQKRLNDNYTLDVTVNNNKLTAIAKQKHNISDWKKSLSISFRMYVPQNVSTDLTTSGGNISLNNLSGNENFTTSGGNLQLAKLSGKLKGTTSGGNITVSDASNDIFLQTSGGNIEAAKCSGNIKIRTSGGNLEMTNLSGTIIANTSGGNVEGNNIQGELTTATSGGNIELKDLSCSIETSTSGGEIAVSVASLGKYIKISNSGGDVDLKLPAGSAVDLDISGKKINTSGLNNFNGNTEDNKIVGKLNNGGIPVKVDAGNGRVKIAVN